MGITIVQKSDLKKPKPDPKIALVLSGGAVSGGAFQLGGLKALNRLMANRDITDFDMFVGISSGSILATYFANGVTVEELYQSLVAQKGRFKPVTFAEFYSPNYTEMLKTPLHILGDMVSISSRNVAGFVSANNIFRKPFRDKLMALLIRPNSKTLDEFISYCLKREGMETNHPSLPWHYLPRGIFKTEAIERSTRNNLKKNHLHNDFSGIRAANGKELYIVAMNLDSAERAVFGHDRVNTIPVSKAMQASIAFPLFFRPVNIDGVDYVDGAIIKTTSMDIAIEKEADLIICYNPFRPFNHDSFSREPGRGRKRINIAKDGIGAVLSQVLRTMLHTRLMHGLDLYRKNPEFTGDIILIEPTEQDDRFFDMNPLSYASRKKAFTRGFESVRESITNNYGMLNRILDAYGIETTPQLTAADGDALPSAGKSPRERLPGFRLPRPAFLHKPPRHLARKFQTFLPPEFRRLICCKFFPF